jgi:hypothetical protein
VRFPGFAFAAIAVLLTALAGGSATAAWGAGPVSHQWAGRWRADLRYVADSLAAFHPDLYHAVTRERFRGALDSLAARVPSMAHHEITVELARIVALVRDGHTRLTFPFDSAAVFFTGHSRTAAPKVPGLVFRHYPIRLGWFADGVWVVQADAAHRELLGGRVVELGELPIERALAAVEPTVQRDNDRTVLSLLPTWLVVPEILHARGVVRDMERARLVVTKPGGARREGWLAPVSPGTGVEWIDARSPGEPPWMDRNPERRHWFATMPGTRTVYARYREVMDDPGEPVHEFASALFRHVEETHAERLILDLRGNVGGNGFLNRPLMLGITRAERLWRPGGLFALIDRGTFSAALMLASDLETRTPTLFAGEKTGGAPNGYGDSRRRVLPNTGLTIRVSSLYWQTTDPRDARDGITAHIEAGPRFEDWQARRDSVLEKVLALGAGGGAWEGAWDGTITIGHQRIPMALRLGRASSGWNARVDLPGAGLADREATEVALTDGEMKFTLASGGGPWGFSLRSGGDALVGVVSFQGATFPLIAGHAAAR